MVFHLGVYGMYLWRSDYGNPFLVTYKNDNIAAKLEFKRTKLSLLASAPGNDHASNVPRLGIITNASIIKKSRKTLDAYL